jgi:ribosomal protein S10
MILPETSPVTDIISLIICNKRHEIESSIINKIQSIFFAISLNAPEAWIMDTLCYSFDFKPHSEFLRECERINNLPKEIKQFCHDKKISLKQLVNFTYFPRDLLETLIGWKSVLQLTASTLDEIASNINDYLKRENKNIDDLLSEPEVQEIFDSSLGPRDKTEHFRQLLHLRKFPLLSASNSRIEHEVRSINIPKEVKINWDRTLENKKMEINISVNDPVKWSGILKALQSNELKSAIESILDEL